MFDVDAEGEEIPVEDEEIPVEDEEIVEEHEDEEHPVMEEHSDEEVIQEIDGAEVALDEVADEEEQGLCLGSF